MRTLSKFALIVILVLSLSLFVHQKPVLCMTAVEYGLVLYGKIILPGSAGITEQATITVSFDYISEADMVFSGVLTISSDNKYKNKTYEYSASFNEGTQLFEIGTTAEISLTSPDLIYYFFKGGGVTGNFSTIPPP